MPAFAQEYGLLFAAALLAIVGFLLGSWFGLRALERRLPDGRGWRWTRRAVHPLVRSAPRRERRRRSVLSAASLTALVGLAVVLGRGGFQWRSLRPADAFAHTSSNAVGYLTLNSAYTVLRSFAQPDVPVVHEMPQDVATRLVREMLFEPDERPLDPDFPFLRARPAKGTPKDWNVVVFLMESWSWSEVGPQPGRESRTPFFDSIAKDGTLFANALANGQRSIEAVPSVTASLPGVFPTPFIGSSTELARVRGLGSILAERGYATSFHHGAWLTSMGFDAFTRRAGFAEYQSERDFPAGDERRDGTWGVFDEPFFLDAASRLDSRKGPFCAVLFSLSPHNPWAIPADRRDLFPARPGEDGFAASLRYSDFALSRFFAHARAQPWFAKTLFVITADHTRKVPQEEPHALFHVPILFYGPGLVPARVRDDLASHADILPSILDLLDVPTVHASVGRSLFDAEDGRPARPRYAVVRHGARTTIFSDRYAYAHDVPGHAVGLFDWHADPRFTHDLSPSRPDEAAHLRDRLFADLQCVTTSVVADRIWRDRKPGER
jgi:phosphoglycerol transferase MdoB-like AlkP superfamily enzyme